MVHDQQPRHAPDYHEREGMRDGAPGAPGAVRRRRVQARRLVGRRHGGRRGRPVGGGQAATPTRSSPTAGAPRGPSTTRGRPRSRRRSRAAGSRGAAVPRCCSPTASRCTSPSWPPSAPALTVVGLGHRAGDRELRHILGVTGAAGIVTLAEHRGAPRRRAGRCAARRRPRPRATRGGRRRRRGRRPASTVPPSTWPPAPTAPDDLFLLNSTSGTTGMPKVVMHNQNRWMYFHQLAAEAGAMTGDDVFLGALPAPFGFGLWTSHVTPAVLGATTVVSSPVRRRRGAPPHRARAGHGARVREHAVPDDARVAARRGARPHVAAVHVHRRRGGARRARRPLRGRHRREGAPVLRLQRDRRAQPHHARRRPRAPLPDRRAPDRRHARAPARRRRPRPHRARRARQPGVPGPRHVRSATSTTPTPTSSSSPPTAGCASATCACSTPTATCAWSAARPTSSSAAARTSSAPAVEAEVSTHPAVAVAAAVPVPDEVFGERVVRLRGAGRRHDARARRPRRAPPRARRVARVVPRAPRRARRAPPRVRRQGRQERAPHPRPGPLAVLASQDAPYSVYQRQQKGVRSGRGGRRCRRGSARARRGARPTSTPGSSATSTASRR